MKKIQKLPESSFLKLFFAFTTLCFLTAAFCMPDRNSAFAGLFNILTQPCRIVTNNFSVGGFAGTFLNMGLVGLCCLLLLHITRAEVNSGSVLAFLLAVGFSGWGINLLNMWFTVAGVVLFCLVKKKPFGKYANAMLFSTGIAPLISELLFRYPGVQPVGFHLSGLVLALGVGLLTGFFLPAGLVHSPKIHKGMDLYSAALPVGMMAFLWVAVLYKTIGVALPGTTGDLGVTSQLTVNVFCGVVFGLCVVLALLLGCTPKKYWQLLRARRQVTDVAEAFGNSTFLMNTGVYGLMILGYYNLIGAPFNGVTFGVIFCMLATCCAGSHPGNVWPVLLGYYAASLILGALSSAAGGNFEGEINAQVICIGVCFANGLSPIADKYGRICGIVAGVLHYCLVTSIPLLHGGFCLHNGGFTAAMVCILMVPVMEKFFPARQERQGAE